MMMQVLYFIINKFAADGKTIAALKKKRYT